MCYQLIILILFTMWQPWFPQPIDNAASDVSFNELPARQQVGHNKAVRTRQETRPVSSSTSAICNGAKLLVQ
jgi:hypothetical protein